MDQSDPKGSMLAGRTATSSEGGRGTGRSKDPNDRVERWPTSEPAVMPSSIGLNSPIIWLNQASVGSAPMGSAVMSVPVPSVGDRSAWAIASTRGL